MGRLRIILIALGVAGLVAAAWLIGEVQSDRRSDDVVCSLDRADCQPDPSWGPVIFLAALSIVALVVAARMRRGRGHSSTGS